VLYDDEVMAPAEKKKKDLRAVTEQHGTPPHKITLRTPDATPPALRCANTNSAWCVSLKDTTWHRFE